eukprot:3434649-Rhodomonas_salina.3
MRSQQRSPAVAALAEGWAARLAEWASKSEFKTVLLLTSLPAELRTDDRLSEGRASPTLLRIIMIRSAALSADTGSAFGRRLAADARVRAHWPRREEAGGGAGVGVRQRGDRLSPLVGICYSVMSETDAGTGGRRA